jgi:hypothetical protein
VIEDRWANGDLRETQVTVVHEESKENWDPKAITVQEDPEDPREKEVAMDMPLNGRVHGPRANTIAHTI